MLKDTELLVAMLENFAGLVSLHQMAFYLEKGDLINSKSVETRVVMGRKFAKVDVGGPFHWSGKYMVELATGRIYGIKAYGVVNRGHRYGTLATIAEFNWGGFFARRLPDGTVSGAMTPMYEACTKSHDFGHDDDCLIAQCSNPDAVAEYEEKHSADAGVVN